MSRKPKTPVRNSPPTAPDDVSITGSRRTTPGAGERPRDARREGDGALETYEQKVERASVESLAEHPDGSAPPMERLVDAEDEKKR
jgi:hypothetical protein